MRLRPVPTVLALGFAGLFLATYLAATGYLIYRDDLIEAAVTRQVDMQYTYEDRIAALRSEIDRITSRHIVQTEGVEQQLARLLDRQMLIEGRQAALDELAEKARAAGIPIEGVREGRGTAEVSARTAGPLLTAVESSLDNAQEQQTDQLGALSAAAHGAVDRISAALVPIGIKVDGGDEPKGGPFIPAEGLHFVEHAALVGRTLDEISAWQRSAEALPVGSPVDADRISSRFGYRLDPFLRRPAFHAGLDMVAPAGTEVRAAAPGRVVSAGWSGGYGKVVEIRHADGLTTRYGHLSAVLVMAGLDVKAGTPIGRVGSTGRSTGPHLHYETRRNGDAVNPTIFLAAGRALRGQIN